MDDITAILQLPTLSMPCQCFNGLRWKIVNEEMNEYA
jgi:hypothetical protein